MKAIIRYRNKEVFMDSRIRQAKFEAEVEHVEDFLKEAVRQRKIPKYSYITSVKRGSTTYIWNDRVL